MVQSLFSSRSQKTNQISDRNGVVRTETYGYDELYRLTSVNYGDSHSQSYTFDPMGNRLTKVNDGVGDPRAVIPGPKQQGNPGPSTSTSSNVSIGSKPDFETIYKRPTGAPKPQPNK